MSNNQLFAAFIKWMIEDWPGHPFTNCSGVLALSARNTLNDEDTIEQQALNYFIDQYDSITQS